MAVHITLVRRGDRAFFISRAFDWTLVLFLVLSITQSSVSYLLWQARCDSLLRRGRAHRFKCGFGNVVEQVWQLSSAELCTCSLLDWATGDSAGSWGGVTSAMSSSPKVGVCSKWIFPWKLPNDASTSKL